MQALLNKVKGKPKDQMPELLGYMNWSRTQTHVWHLQTDNKALHKTLNKYYEDIVDFIDELSEIYLGHYPEKKKTFVFEIPDLQIENLDDSVEKVSSHIMEMTKKVDSVRASYKNMPSLVNVLDNVDSYLNKVLYLLTLK